MIAQSVGARSPGEADALAAARDAQAWYRQLAKGTAADQAAFTRSAASGDNALAGLVPGMLAAALLMAAAGAWGLHYLLAEYR